MKGLKMMADTIGKVTQKAKIAAGLFWADYSVLGAQAQELEAAGVDWEPVGCILNFKPPKWQQLAELL